MKQIIEKILSEQTALQSLPQTLAEVLKTVRDENSSSAELAGVLAKDPALTAKVLRIANSPYYGIGREISSMNQAVVTMGMRQVTALALSSSVYNLTRDWQGSFDRVRFWRHSLEVAIASRMIAETLGGGSPEDAFVAGLLHDIGLLVLEKSFPDESINIRKGLERGEALIDLEEEAWNTNHARVGQFLLEQWSIPDAICTAIGHHHDLFAEGTSNPDIILSQVVALADMLSRFTLYEEHSGASGTVPENRKIVAENLSLSPQKLAEIQKQLFSKTVEEARYLEIKIGSAEELLEEANQMLFDQYLAVEELLQENRKLQRELARDRMRRMAGESLREIAASLNRHISGATGSIVRRAHRIQTELSQNGPVADHQDLVKSMQSVIDGVGTIGSVMKDLTNLAFLETEGEPDSDRLLEIEEKLKDQLREFETTESVV